MLYPPSAYALPPQQHMQVLPLKNLNQQTREGNSDSITKNSDSITKNSDSIIKYSDSIIKVSDKFKIWLTWYYDILMIIKI